MAQEISSTNAPPRHRRWLLGLEPIFEGGWFHKGRFASTWDVEEELRALSVLGDVTIDLSKARTTPGVINVKAYAVGRDVDILVRPGTRIEMSGRSNNDHLENKVPPPAERDKGDEDLVRIAGHTFLGDVTVRVAE